jgi:far upstream element-binding protein
VGKLIGKGGETIKQLQYSTQTRVQIDHQTPGDVKRVTISGPSRECVEGCRQQVEQIVSTEELGGGGGGGGGGASRTVDCPQVCASE